MEEEAEEEEGGSSSENRLSVRPTHGGRRSPSEGMEHDVYRGREGRRGEGEKKETRGQEPLGDGGGTAAASVAVRRWGRRGEERRASATIHLHFFLATLGFET